MRTGRHTTQGRQAVKRFLMARALATAVVLTVLAVFAGSAEAHTNSTWYWTPGACKSELAKGVQFDDGRTFYVQRAFCVGMHNHCWLSDGLRRYKVFVAVVRSYDGTVRRFQLTVTGHHTWRGVHFKIIERSMTATAFVNGYGSAAWSVARVENQGGCFDIHP
jgi:hypothetical protein